MNLASIIAESFHPSLIKVDVATIAVVAHQAKSEIAIDDIENIGKEVHHHRAQNQEELVEEIPHRLL